MRVGVFCSWRVEKDVPDAWALGRALGEAGLDIVYGGDPRGAMGAVAAGAKWANATVTAVTLLEWEEAHPLPPEERLCAATTLEERAQELYARSDAFLVLNGGIGTLRELIDVWDARANGFHDKPIVVLDPSLHWAHLWHLLLRMVSDGYCAKDELSTIRLVPTIQAAIHALKANPSNGETQ